MLKKVLLGKKGDAMIAVMCVMCVFIALAFTLLLASAVLMASTQKLSAQEQCRIGAMTFAELIKNDMTSPSDSELKEYLKGELKNGRGSSWYYYNEDGEPFHNLDSAGVVRSFDFGELPLDTSEGNKSVNITLRMYWQTVGDTNVEDPDDLGIRLVIFTTCEYQGEKFVQKSYYDRGITKETGDDGSEVTVWAWKIVWKE